MRILFDFYEDAIAVECPPPSVTVDDITVPGKLKLRKVDGKMLPRFVRGEPITLTGMAGRRIINLLPIKFKVSDFNDSNPIFKLIHQRMELQMSAFRNQPSAASIYKFNAALTDNDTVWDLNGCFFNCVEYADRLDGSGCITVELSIDNVPDLV